MKKTILKVSDTWDGNVFAVMGNTKKYLRDAKRSDLANKVTMAKANELGEYSLVVNFCMELLKEAGYDVR